MKKVFLLSILTLSTAIVRPEETMNHNLTAITTLGSNTVEFVSASDANDNDALFNASNKSWYANSIANNNARAMIGTTVGNAYPGLLVGAFTGTAISYLSGKLFDAAILNIIARFYGEISPKTAILARLAVQIGSKQYWEKPLRNKIINWLIAELKAKGVDFNEELTKTIARVSAWVGTVSQINVA